MIIGLGDRVQPTHLSRDGMFSNPNESFPSQRMKKRWRSHAKPYLSQSNESNPIILWNLLAIENGPVEIVDFPIKNGHVQ